jgi:SAM-dependent methyltransferase
VGQQQGSLEVMALRSGARTLCRACGGELAVTFADLGLQPPANAYLAPAADLRQEKRYPLRAKVCGTCLLVQVDFDVPPRELFSNYAYFSSYSDDWLAHARRFCSMARERFALDAQSLVIELGSNDGYLLKEFVAAGIPVLGIDPSDTVAAAAERIGVATLVEFFGARLAARLALEGRQADLIVGNNVLAHVPELNDFVAGIARLLKPAGSVTIEFPHLLRLIEHAAFDTIYHEHFSYISLYAIERVFRLQGLQIYDVEELPTHGGSLRIFATHTSRAPEDSAALRRVRAEEERAGIAQLDSYRRFSERVGACRRSLREFLAHAKSAGKVVAAYGAAAKGNTLLNFCDVTADDISMVADRNPHKQSKLLPGSHIPVVSPEELARHQPDYVLILPWNLRTEIMRQLDGIRAWGGRFLTAVPTVRCYE